MKRIKKYFIFVIAAGLVLYFSSMATLYFNQDTHVYYPLKPWIETPEKAGLSFENLMIPTSDGLKISAWYVASPENKGSVIFFHGNARNISHEVEAMKMFYDFGWNILSVDYRGYGKSEGKPTEEGTYQDAQAAWDWLVGVKNEKPERIVLCGRSLGAAIAADLASKNKPQALILEAGFTSLTDAAQSIYPYFPVRLLSKYRYDTVGKLKNISCPVLVVHSHDDELIPFSHGKRLYEHVTGQKAMIELGGPHKGGWKPTLGKYESGVKDFLAGL